MASRFAASSIAIPLLFFFPTLGHAWGELGHHLVARTAAKLVAFHPILLEHKGKKEHQKAVASFVEVFRTRAIQQGHLSNIPDIYWRNLESKWKKDGNLLGDPTHYLNADRLANFSYGFFHPQIPVDYEEAKKRALKRDPEVSFFSARG